MACSHKQETNYIVQNKFTITVKTERGGIELVPILSVYCSGSNDYIIVGLDIFEKTEVGDIVVVVNKNVVRVINGIK